MQITITELFILVEAKFTGHSKVNHKPTSDNLIKLGWIEPIVIEENHTHNFFKLTLKGHRYVNQLTYVIPDVEVNDLGDFHGP